MSVFQESARLFPYYVCQTGLPAEFSLRHLHSGLRQEVWNKKKIDVGGLILDSIFVSTPTTKNH